jgi:hypothetical protein
LAAAVEAERAEKGLPPLPKPKPKPYDETQLIAALRQCQGQPQTAEKQLSIVNRQVVRLRMNGVAVLPNFHQRMVTVSKVQQLRRVDRRNAAELRRMLEAG